MNGTCDANLDLLMTCESVFACILVLQGATLRVQQCLSVAVFARVLC